MIRLYHLLKSSGLRGRGVLVRWLSRWHPQSARFPFQIEGLGTIHADLRLGSVLPLFDYAGGDLGQSTHLATTMARFLKPGDRLWDVGANIGTIALHFAQSQFGLQGIDVFEPNPDLAANLRMMFENIPKVNIHSVALGDQPGQAHLHLDSNNDSCTASLVNGFPNERQLPVAVTTGDTIWRETQTSAPAVIKIDVEGFEPRVIAGLQDVVARAQPVIFFEHLFLSNEQIQSFIPVGYAWYLILDHGELTGDVARRDAGHDSVLVPSNRLEELRALLP